MDITPTPLGAELDLTEESMYVLDLLADALMRHKSRVPYLLIDLAEGRQRRDQAAAQVERPGLDPIRDQRLEDEELGVEAARAELIKLLGGDARVVQPVGEAVCRRYAAAFLEAADQSLPTVWDRARQSPIAFPQQLGRAS